MSDRPNQEQMAKIILPAMAVSAVIVLVGVLFANWNKPDVTVGGGGGKSPTSSPTATPNLNFSTEGLTKERPPVDSPDWKPSTSPGLKIWDVKEGEGEACKPGDTVTIHYTGWTLDGKEFDSSLPRGEPATFPLGNLIAGWQKGIPGMKPGGIRRLYIPWNMGYGESGSPPKIPGKADLIFEIKYYASK